MTSWLHQLRLTAVEDAVRASGARRVLDLGCGDGDFLLHLVREPQIEHILGIDISLAALARLRERLAECRRRGEKIPDVELIHASFADAGPRAMGYDCAVLVEVIEHLDPAQLSVAEQAIFRQISPGTVVVTTPNAEFNSLLGVPSHRFRHPDHRFEWGRKKFGEWAQAVARRNCYSVACSDIAGCHPVLGGASQMAVFRHLGHRSAPDAGA